MTLTPVTFAILGRGTPAQWRFDAIRQSRVTQLVAAVETSLLRPGDPLRYFPVHPSIGGLYLAAPKPSVWMAMDEQPIADAVSTVEAVILSDPRLCTIEYISQLLTEGKHVLAEYLPSTSAEDIERLYTHAAQYERVFHLSCVSVFQGVPMTMAARVNTLSLTNADLVYQSAGAVPDDVGELVYRNIGALVHLAMLTGPISSIVDVTYLQRILRADLRNTQDAIVSITLSQEPTPDMLFDLTVTDHATTWRQLNDALYQGRSPQTILQGMDIYQDDLARFARSVRTQAPLHPSKGTWLDSLRLASALTQLAHGPVDSAPQ